MNDLIVVNELDLKLYDALENMRPLDRSSAAKTSQKSNIRTSKQYSAAHTSIRSPVSRTANHGPKTRPSRRISVPSHTPAPRSLNHSSRRISQVFSDSGINNNIQSDNRNPSKQPDDNQPELQVIPYSRKRECTPDASYKISEKRMCKECLLSCENLSIALKNTLIRQQIEQQKIEHELKMANLKLDLKIKQAQYDNLVNRRSEC